MNKILITAMIALSLAAPVHAAIVEVDPQTAAGSKTFVMDFTTVRKLVFTVTSDGSGDASLVLPKITGLLNKIVFKLGETTLTPDNLWDVVLYNRDATVQKDILEGQGANLSNTVDTILQPTIGGEAVPNFEDGNLKIVFSGMGALNVITMEIWILK